MTRPSTPLNRHQVKSIFQGLEYTDATPPQARPLSEAEQGFLDHWTTVVRRSDGELARLFAAHAPLALTVMTLEQAETWLLKALEAFDRRGLGWAVEILEDPLGFQTRRRDQARRLTLEEVAPRLARLVLGLGGRPLRIAGGDPPHTDTETLFLPPRLDLGDRDKARTLYRAQAIHLWAQTCFGTWHPAILAQLEGLSDARHGAFTTLERVRLDHCIERELPGAWREMAALGRELDGEHNPPTPWREAFAALADPGATAQDALRLAGELAHLPQPQPACHHGALLPGKVRGVLAARLAREKERLQALVGRLQREMAEDEGGRPATDRPGRQDRRNTAMQISLESAAGRLGSTRVSFQLKLEERRITPPKEIEDLLQSIHQDLGEIPEDYLIAGGQKYYEAGFEGGGQAGPAAETAAMDALRYPEWDHTRQRFRPDYCALKEREVAEGDPTFVLHTLAKYRGLVKSIRRSFEALLGEPRLERRQPAGDDIDLDALVAARADLCRGEEVREGLYTARREVDRSIAVTFMVDMSGSTKGWVNEAERESLVLLCEALETIGDVYAIYGFSGRTHKRVEVYRVKGFGERYDQRVKGRIAGIKPQAYTRMGAPIRHLGDMLKRVPARHKLLVTLSDGKPEDYGSYYGRYGIEDTRHALLELRRDGVHPFCITIDRQGGDYLPHMYGPANYALIDRVDQLPLKVADIYRKLTSR